MCLTIVCGLAAAQLPSRCVVDSLDGKAMYRYKVEKSIGLWRIGQMFSVSQEEIIALNPQLRERGLHMDEELWIPIRVTEKATVAEEMPTVETKVNTTAAAEDAPVVQEVPVVDSTAIRLALLLPLQVKAVQRDRNMERFFDFYEGALLAVKDIETAGQALEVYVYDVDKTDIRIEQLIGSGELDSMHAIIGPAYPMQVRRMAAYCKQTGIKTLIPFSDQVPEIETTPELIQFNVSNERKAEVMADYLESRGSDVHCVLVQARDADIPSSIVALRHEIMRRGIDYTQVSIRQILSDSLGSALRDSVENILIFNTEKYGNLQMLMPHVLNAKSGKRVTLMGQYSWQKENILLPQVYVSVFGTSDERDTAHYEAMFEQYFATKRSSDTPRYDLLGYDIVRTMVALLRGEEYKGLQSDIVLERAGEEGGYQNAQVRVVTLSAEK